MSLPLGSGAGFPQRKKPRIPLLPLLLGRVLEILARIWQLEEIENILNKPKYLL
jgi:hypothetical protein